MSEPTPTHARGRRWGRFGIVALFAIVCLCVAGYEWNWIRQRRHVVERQAIKIELLAEPLTDIEMYSEAPPDLPLSMRLLMWLGENPRQMTILILYDDKGSGQLSEQHKYELAEARSLFPESAIAWKLTTNR